MGSRYARIAGLGQYVPPHVVTNQDLARLVDTSDEWIQSRTGITERHFVEGDEATSSMAARAGCEALATAGARADEVDLVIVATSTPDYPLFPSTACLVQASLGLTRAGAYDISAACSGFVYGLITASQFIATGAYEHVLVIGADALSRFVNFEDRSTCVLFADGAGAAMLVASDTPGGLLSFVLGADGTGGEHLIVPAGGSRRPPTAETVGAREHSIHMNGREVYRFSTTVPADALRRAAADAGLAVEDLSLVVAHQANVRILQTVARNLNVPEDLFFRNVERFGNTSAASVPLALYDACAQRRLKPGALVGLMGFGAGLTWATAIWRWHDLPSNP
ncbi:MAG: beta-ketoacyl-ACP synthase III [Chloroflexi bacterium]|nr:beta-ketoacyl-ACP synthase III [Chloroflexota bacterium]